jgi:hypothetical protein
MKGWWLIAIVAVVAGCQESLTSPGACPDYCPAARLQVRDTVLNGALVREEWFQGYVRADRASAMQVASDGTQEQSRAVVRFFPLADSVSIGSELRPITAIDSFRLRFTLLRRRQDVSDLEVRIHRIPVSVDTSWGFADLDPYFQDSTLLATIVIPDSVLSDSLVGDSLVTVLAGDAFPTLAQDSQTVAVGLAVRGDQAAYVDLGSRQGTAGQSALTRYVQADSSGTNVSREESRSVDLDTFAARAIAAPGADAVAVGGVPAARAFLRLSVPDTILQRSNVVRATLLLVPAEPALGAPGDTLSLRAFALEADYGPKSRFVPSPVDSIVRGAVDVAVGSADTIRIDVTHIVRPWQADTTRPRTILLRIVPEGATLGEVRLATSRSAGPKPAIRITYVPLFLSGGGTP